MLTGNLFHQNATLPLLRQSLITDGPRRRHWTRSSLVLTWLDWATQLKLSAGVLPLVKRRKKDRLYRLESFVSSYVCFVLIQPVQNLLAHLTIPLSSTKMSGNFGAKLNGYLWSNGPRYISCGNQLKFYPPVRLKYQPLFGRWACAPPHPPHPPPNRRPCPLREDLESSGNRS